MREGIKLYYKHIVTFMVLFGVLLLVAVAFSAPPLSFVDYFIGVIILIPTYVYFVLLFFGAFWRRGAFKKVGLLLRQDSENELNELRPKQPWG